MEYIDEVLSLIEQIRFKGYFSPSEDFSNIAILGMGGSGIVGQLFREIYTKKPVTVVSDYNIPDFISEKTLVIAVSHSGNTEETIHAMEKCESRGSRIVIITSGGKMSAKDHEKVTIPGELQPRCSLGYMLIPILRSFGLFDEKVEGETNRSLQTVVSIGPDIEKISKSLVDDKKIPVVYGISPTPSVAYRWKTQFNENAKMLAFNSAIPEMNHNELAAMPSCYGLENFMFFIAGHPDGRIRKRVEAMEEITGVEFHEIPVFSGNVIANTFSAILYGDLLTYYAAVHRGVDPRDVSAITKLKRILSS